MKKIFALALVAASLTAAPAMAQTFTGVRVEATAGADDVTKLNDTTDVVYGAAVGLDAPVFGGKLVVGVEGSVDNVFERRSAIAGSVRVGVPVGRVMPYVKAGYENFRDLDGIRVGGGLEYALTKNLYTKAEYRYTDFQNSGAGRHQGLVGVGIRF